VVKYILLGLVLIKSLLAIAEPSQRLIISAGILDNSSVYHAFYQSRVFLGAEQPFIVSDANIKTYVSHGTLFYSEEQGDLEDIIKAGVDHKNQPKIHQGLVAPSYALIPVNNNQAPALEDSIINYLGSTKHKFNCEIRAHKSNKIYACRFDAASIIWPKNSSELHDIPAVIIQETKSSKKYLVAARALGDFRTKLDLIDTLQQNHKQAHYLDLGINSNLNDWSSDQVIIQEVAKRRPEALLLGIGEITALAADSQAFSAVPVLYPFGNFTSQHSGKLNLWSLAGQEKLWSLFTYLGEPKKLEASFGHIKKARAQAPEALNIIRVFSEAAALEAAKSMLADIVLLAVDDQVVFLPERESIVSKAGEMAPIVRISQLDITEVEVSLAPLRKRVDITRHETVSNNFAGSTPHSQSLQAALPALAHGLWHRADFDRVLAGMMLKEHKGDVAIFESEAHTTPINGPVNFELARAHLMRPGTMVSAVINGKQLKKIAGLISQKALGINLVVFGMDPKTRHIRERAINDAERYDVVLSEKALLELYRIALYGGLNEEYGMRSIFAEQIQIKLASLFFLSGIKSITNSDASDSLKEATINFTARQSFASLLSKDLPRLTSSEIDNFISKPGGSSRHTLTLAIDYLDVGASFSTANKLYKDFLKAKQDSPLASISRAGTPLDMHFLLFSKLALVYNAPAVEFTLGNTTAYLHIGEGAPERDKTVFTLDARLPWERSLFKNKKIIVSPVWRNSFETQIAPNGFLPRKPVDASRLKIRKLLGESMLGVNVNFTDLGFNFDIGPMMAVNFNRSSVREAVDFGPRLNFSGRWNLVGPLELITTFKTYYLFGLPGTHAPNKIAYALEGTTWLRVARFYDFNISLVADLLMASLQSSPRDMAISSVYGVTVSYSRFFRLLG
jgi:hypothetical protein